MNAAATNLPAARAPRRSLVLAQSWVPFTGPGRERAGLRQSALRAAEAFTNLANQLAARRRAEKSFTA